MTRKDHHSEPYDEGTLLKLELFERYCRSWLPVFIKSRHTESINIVDFFCGPGQDCQGIPGSPLRILGVINHLHPLIRTENKKIATVFNDKKREKINNLQTLITDTAILSSPHIIYSSIDFHDCFESLQHNLSSSNTANLLFIDPTGLINGDTLKKISRLKLTDFLLFFPAEHIHRFKTTQEFQKIIPGIEKIHSNSPKDLVKCFSNFLRSNYLKESGYNIAHFGIKKAAGTTHGVIFGSRSYLGLEKFLRECWSLDPENGEATFALDGDLPNTKAGQLGLPGIVESSKLRKFNEAFAADVLAGKIRTNKDAYIYSLHAACLPSHAKDVLSKLKKEKKIHNVPPLGYDIIFRQKRIEVI